MSECVHSLGLYIIFLLIIIIIMDFPLVSSKDYNWTWIPSKNLTSWYQPWEICVLKSSDILQDIKDTKRKCMEIHGKPSDGIGMRNGWGAFRCRAGGLRDGRFPCRKTNDSSLRSRSHLTSVILGYDDPSRTYVKDIFLHLALANSSLLLVGDSFTKELGQALTCEIERAALQPFSWTTVISRVHLPPSTFSATSHLSHLSPHTHHVPLERVVFNHLKPHFTNLYDLDRHLSVRLSDPSQQGLLIIFNIGVWYNDYSQKYNKEIYKYHLSSLLVVLNSLKKRYPNKAVGYLWTETTAQHYPHPSRYNGSYPGNGYHTGSERSPPCAAIPRPERDLDWRNQEADALLRNKTIFSFNSSQEFFMRIPLRKWSEELWDLHPVSPRAVFPVWSTSYPDCTHFCWTPMMYQPIFDIMSQAAFRLRETVMAMSKT
mmetsp:Transcript_9435/g.9500  ORF Transcript_9435/g.9500 Transcript_9435/m.9500 type:complete len:429 (+) Transcript_9435:70-1356(+)